MARLPKAAGLDIPKPAHMRLWAKTDRCTEKTHALLYHLIDVGQVALALWAESFSPDRRGQFAAWLGLDKENAGNLLVFCVGLHDIGKASPAFQCKYPPAVAELEKAGFDFPDPKPYRPAPHGLVSVWVLQNLLVSELTFPESIAEKIAHALGGHHGAWPSLRALQSSQKTTSLGNTAWNEAHETLIREMKNVFEPSANKFAQNVQFPTSQIEENALLTLFSGLTSVADWIGSMKEHFPMQSEVISTEEYVPKSAQRAHDALQRLGWLGWQPVGAVKTFQELFPKFSAPNLVQKCVIKVEKDITPPALVILEAPTGSGKTEAAFYLADGWLQTMRGQGLYIAMPSQATSNQMYKRTVDFLKQRYPEDVVHIQLIHGNAPWSKDQREIELNEIGEGEEKGGRLVAMTWFQQNRKRTLLAPFGVGTVDQAFMSVLQTRHFFMRLLGLAQKVIIFDEVHAYDTYMSTLFEQLLGWLRAVGASVVILSATLPEATRGSLLRAYLGQPHVAVPAVPYPRLTYTIQDTVKATQLPSSDGYTIHLRWIDAESQEIAHVLKTELREGGCAAVICNRVARAQEIYREIKDAQIVPEDDLFLFHARFPFAWREQIEEQILTRFSKGGDRRRSIVVATQVIEQSLDLDFDLMVSDLAPIDLLIQRAGRLHRHSQNDATRPDPLQKRQLLITRPGLENGLPDFGNDVFVYKKFVLLQTYFTVRDLPAICNPTNTTALVEAVYGDSSNEHLTEDARDALSVAKRDMEHKNLIDSYQARQNLIPEPHTRDYLECANQELDEDDPAVHKAFRAMTRLIDPGVSLICLHQMGHGMLVDPDDPGTEINLHRAPSRTEIELLLKHAVTVRHRAIVDHFLSRSLPEAWEKTAALRYYAHACFVEGRYRVESEGGEYVLHLNREYGLSIEKEA